MKVFISYGHNDYVSLVNRLFDALSEEGLEPWKDDRYEGQSGIKPGDEFIKVIQKAILDSDYVVAFVTKATIQKDFCCDERVYAYNHKGTRFIQIRLDKVDILLGNSKSYIDMDDCINPDGTINEKMFAEKLRALFSAFRDPDSFAEGGFTPWAKFEAHLRIPGAVKYEEFTTMPEQDDFVGREWLKKKCISWVQDDTIPYRLFVILGEAGTGKTAFIRHLAKDKALVRSVHICIYDRPSTRKAEDTLKDLAYILAKNNNRYFNFLKNLNFEKLREMDIDGLFEFLFIDPLKQETEKYLLIIDGLDELDDIMGFTPLMKIFRQYANKINPNISFLVTGRPDDNITHKLNTVGFEENNQVLLNTQNSSDDLLNFIDIKLNELGCFSENLRSKIFNASDNNFEYLTLLFKEAKEEGLNFSENMKLPHGLNERYTQYMDRRTEQFGQFGILNDEQSMLLDILSVTYEPVPVSLLAMISQMTERKTKKELKVFGSLIKSEKTENNESYISFFSKGFRDFLTGGVCDNYSTDANEGQALITEYILNNCKCEADFKKYPYIDKHGFIHLFIYASKKKQTVLTYLKQLKGIDNEATCQRIANAICLSPNDTTRFYCENYETIDMDYEVMRILKYRRATEIITKTAETFYSIGQNDIALILMGDASLINITASSLEFAENCYIKALEIRQTKYNEDPGFINTRRLAGAFERLAQIQKEKNTTESLTIAEEYYNKALFYFKQNREKYPCHDSIRCLEIIFERLGDITRNINKPDAKEISQGYFKEKLKLSLLNYRNNNCYESRRNLAISCERLALIHKTNLKNLKHAERLFLYELELTEENMRTQYCYDSIRAVEIVYENLGDIQLIKKDADIAKAKMYYEKKLELSIINHKTHPCFDSKRNLAISYNKMSSIVKREKNDNAQLLIDTYNDSMLSLFIQNYSDYPSCMSRRDLAVAYEILADAELISNNAEKQKSAEKLFLKSNELFVQNLRDYPNADNRQSLAFSYSKLGSLYQSQNTTESLKNAEKMFKQQSELIQENYSENPSIKNKQHLLSSYAKLYYLYASFSSEKEKAEADYWLNCYKKLNSIE